MMLTHYERVFKEIWRYDQEGRRFAQEAMTMEEPVAYLLEYLLEAKAKLDKVGSNKQLLQALTPINSRVLCYCHHLTMAFLQAQTIKTSFTELATNPRYGQMMAVSTASRSEVVMNSQGQMHYHVAVHRMAGSRVYDVSPGLAEQLRHTELRGLTAADLKLPYQSVYLMVPPEADLVIWNDSSAWHKVIGIYIAEETTGTRGWRILVCGEPKPVQVLDGLTDDNDALVFWMVQLPEGASLEEVISLTQKESLEDVEDLRKKGRDMFSPMIEKWQGIFQWAMNVILYASMEGAESEDIVANKEARQIIERLKKLHSGKKRENLKEKLRGMHQNRRTVLGRSVTAQRGGWHLTVRVRVRGHWRNQPHGPGRSLRRLQWIEPFWRGPDNDVAEPVTEVASASQETGGGIQDEPRNGESSRSTDGVEVAAAQQDHQCFDGGCEGTDHGHSDKTSSTQ